jgi:hypothetical protein
MRSDVFVVSAPIAEGELFAIFRSEEMLGSYMWLKSKSLEELRAAFDRLLQTAPILSEDEVRAQLADMGLPNDAIEDQLDRARRMHIFNAQASSGQLAWETTTAIGYRNNHGQEVRQKTERAGTLEFQKVYVLRCGHCGHEYEADGCEVHSHRCPHCQSA